MDFFEKSIDKMKKLFYNLFTLSITERKIMIRTNITGIGDPYIIKVGSVFHAYATSAPDGFLRFSSPNLTDWTKEGYCLRNSPWVENCYWAPEVSFYRGKYYMLYTGRWNKNHSLRLGLACSDSPCGPFTDLAPAPLFDPGYACIDGTFFFDDDGKIYLYYARDCSENVISGVHTSEIYCSRMSADLRSLETEPVKVTSPTLPWETEHDPLWRWNEGPALLKHGGKYYLNFSVNCYDCPAYSVGCAVADSPFGPFEKYPAPVLKRMEGDFSGPGHNSFFRDGGKLYTAFHIHTDPARPSGDRRICIAEAGFDGAGVFRILL